jgi:hypothetical protein
MGWEQLRGDSGSRSCSSARRSLIWPSGDGLDSRELHAWDGERLEVLARSLGEGSETAQSGRKLEHERRGSHDGSPSMLVTDIVA